MSPDLKRDFESEWPALAARLRRLFAHKKVDASSHDDLIQEVALRLLIVWDRVDRDRSPWPLASTIALNLLRDETRVRPIREVVGAVPELLESHDVERATFARVELARVRKAMTALTAAQRSALLNEIGDGRTAAVSPDAEKMLRMRARRRLQVLLENVSAVVTLRHRRITDLFQGLAVGHEGLAHSVGCIACLIIGFATIGIPSASQRAEVAVAAPGFADITSATVPDGEGAYVTGATMLSDSGPNLHPPRTGEVSDPSARAPSKARRSAAESQDPATAPAATTPSLPRVPLPPGGGDEPVPVPAPSAPAPPAPEEPPEPPVTAPDVPRTPQVPLPVEAPELPH